MWKTFLWGFVGHCGRKCILLHNNYRRSIEMEPLIGEFECKLDSKGRMVVPASLKRQLPDVERLGLVVNRGFEKNLVIYTREEWNKKMAQLSSLNQYNPKTRNFIRMFMRGATELTLDAAGRVLLPKSLLEYANIQGEVFLQCQMDQIEVWAKEEYEALMEAGFDEGFSELAQEVMGNFNFGGMPNE